MNSIMVPRKCSKLSEGCERDSTFQTWLRRLLGKSLWLEQSEIWRVFVTTVALPAGDFLHDAQVNKLFQKFIGSGKDAVNVFLDQPGVYDWLFK